MRVLFKYATSSASPPTTGEVEICSNEDAFQLTDIGGKNTLDIFQPAYGVEVKVFDRGNHQGSCGFVVTRLHRSHADAKEYAWTVASDTAGAGVLFVQSDGASSGALWNYIKGGFTNAQVKMMGVTTITTFAFVGGLPGVSGGTGTPLPDPI